MLKLDDLLKEMVGKEASDLHLKVGRPPVVRIHGELISLEESPRIRPNDMDDFIFDVLSDEDQLRLKKNKGIDVAYSLSGVSRFRVNILYQRGTLAMVIRTIPFNIPTIEDLHLPEMVRTLAQANAGQPEVTEQGKLIYSQDIEDYVRYIPRMVENGVNIIGGCCGTNPDYIRRMAEVMGKGS